MRFLRTTFMTAYRARLYPNSWDLLALLLVLAVISLFAWNARQMTTPYELGQPTLISLNPAILPFYAARTVVRMLIALVFSLLFTFTFATWAAKSRRAGRIIIPIIDILQSVPILGFLSVTVTGFIALFQEVCWVLNAQRFLLFSLPRHGIWLWVFTRQSDWFHRK